jgi:hypothetical protein
VAEGPDGAQPAGLQVLRPGRRRAALLRKDIEELRKTLGAAMDEAEATPVDPPPEPAGGK